MDLALNCEGPSIHFISDVFNIMTVFIFSSLFQASKISFALKLLTGTLELANEPLNFGRFHR